MDNDMEDVDKRYDWLHSEHSSVAGDIFGEPQRTARIGDEYQAQIPFLMTENKQLMGLSTSQDPKVDVHSRYRFDLSIPVMWIHNEQKKKKAAKGKSGTDSLVPGSSSESWSAIEHDSFLVGLYIFGKNLRLVNRFVGNNGMQNVLSYYYGRFYKSGEHQKWSIFHKKKRSRKSAPGKKIFNGWRRHELLSRLLPNVTDECKTSLTQATRMFEEEKLSFEKYVLTVRDTVGMDLLVEAIAIGKGKRDLTGRVKKSLKNKKHNSACSSLEPLEIVNLLKDGIGLSKERLNDIFWEAVWPRLLARGWHSEQPRSYASKQSLVFLAPGVTKFSRRSLEKGSQYFDSSSQLLDKVASEPWLLEHKPDHERIVVDSDEKQNLMQCTIVDTSVAGVVTLTSLPVPQQSSSTETEQEESQNEDVNSCLDPLVSRIEEGKPVVRKLKLICKPKATSCNDTLVCEDTRSKKQREGIMIDLNSPRDSALTSKRPQVLLLNGGQRQKSTRNRPLSTKALEALANGFLLNPKKKTNKRRGSEDKTRRRVRAKTALVSSCGAPYRVFNGMVSDSPK